MVSRMLDAVVLQSKDLALLHTRGFDAVRMNPQAVEEGRSDHQIEFVRQEFRTGTCMVPQVDYGSTSRFPVAE